MTCRVNAVTVCRVCVCDSEVSVSDDVSCECSDCVSCVCVCDSEVSVRDDVSCECSDCVSCVYVCVTARCQSEMTCRVNVVTVCRVYVCV